VLHTPSHTNQQEDSGVGVGVGFGVGSEDNSSLGVAVMVAVREVELDNAGNSDPLGDGAGVSEEVIEVVVV